MFGSDCRHLVMKLFTRIPRILIQLPCGLHFADASCVYTPPSTHTHTHTKHPSRTPLIRNLYLHNTKHKRHIHALRGIRTHNPSKRAATNPLLRPRSHRDRRGLIYTELFSMLAAAGPRLPRGLRRGSAAPRLLVLRVRIQPWAWMTCLL